MLSFKSLNNTAILVLSVLASLIDGQVSKTSFTLHQIESNYSVKSGPAALLSTYHKFNRPAPENVQKAAAVNHGTITASPSTNQAAYLTPITIGGQTFNLIIDTGSDFLWTFGSNFASLVHSTYNSSVSNTSRLQDGNPWQNCYEDQSCVGGDLYSETVSAGGITVNDQIIGVAREVTSNFRSLNVSEGILGLSFNLNTMGTPQETTFLDNMKSTLSAPLFTADLKKGIPGSYDFGFIDDSKYTGHITYVPVDTRQGFWGFTLSGYAIGTGKFKFTTVDVIADTGTTLIYLPKKIVHAYYADIPSAFYNSTEAGYVFPCDTTLPSITFRIGNYNAVVPGSSIKQSPLRDETTCYGGIQAGSDSDSFILGDAFLNSQFVVFDAGSEPRLGFAAKPVQKN